MRSSTVRNCFLLPLTLVALSCASAPHGFDSLLPSGDASFRVGVYPATLKLLRDRMPRIAAKERVDLHAAVGEGESAQIIVFSASDRTLEFAFEASELSGPGGFAIQAETGVVGYVRVSKPSFIGFHRKGAYPDPILPNASFSVEASMNQALWLTYTVPRDAPSGRYSGEARVSSADGQTLSIPVSLTVHAVTLPLLSALKTSINFRKENARDSRYYGPDWSKALEDELPFIALKYRFSHRVDLPIMEALAALEAGQGASSWEAFDAALAQWHALGITCFELKLPIRWSLSPEELEKQWGGRLRAINDHIVEKGWTDLVYFYFYDEPFPSEMRMAKERYAMIRQLAPDIPNVLTYGITSMGQTRLRGLIGIWIPNLHQFDDTFARSAQALGEEVWAYACIGNAFREFPDNFRIDWHGTAHRALGWWLFKHKVDGYLYWAVDLWRRDPWVNAATYPWTNGDGMLFYPAPDKTSQVYPSVRAHLMRDAFEDYDLLTLLQERYRLASPQPKEVARLLGAEDLIGERAYFSRDDWLYIEKHDRILELLELAADD